MATGQPEVLGAVHSTPSRRNGPIWIIGLFLGLCETAMTIGAVQTEGFAQWLMTIFAVVFPLYVATKFFRILWNRPYVLYPPTEYGEQGAESFIRAISGALRPPDAEQLKATIREVVNEVISGPDLIQDVLKALPTTVDDAERETTRAAVETVLDQAAARVVEEVEERGFVSISPSPFLPGESSFKVPYDAETTLHGLLAYFLFNRAASRPSARHTSRSALLRKVNRQLDDFGLVWVLRDVATGEMIPEKKWMMAGLHGWEQATLDEVGILPGTILEMVEIGEARKS